MRNYRNYLLVSTLFLMLLIPQTSALMIPAGMLKSAENYQKTGHLQPALENAHLAKLGYEQIGDENGIFRSQALIEDIESNLTPHQLAEIYYNIGGAYYLELPQSMDSLQKAKYFSEIACANYQKIDGKMGENGLTKCQDLGKQIDAKIRNYFVGCMKEGDGLYNQAQNNLYNGQIVQALDYAKNASEKYKACPYTLGINKSITLEKSIQKKIGEGRAEAKVAYDQANIHLKAEDYPNCIIFTRKVLKIYEDLDDDAGIDSVKDLRIKCSKGFDEFIDTRSTEANLDFNEAIKFLLVPDCLNATDRINKAKKIYAGLYEQADNTGSQEHYLALIKDSDDVIKRIENTCRSPRIQEIGEDYYRMAQSKYLAGDYTASMEYANKALEIYTNTKNYVGISKSNTLIILIGKNVGEDQAKERIEAETLLQEAETYKQTGDIETAREKLETAMKKFILLNDPKNINKTLDLLDELEQEKQEMKRSENQITPILEPTIPNKILVILAGVALIAVMLAIILRKKR